MVYEYDTTPPPSPPPRQVTRICVVREVNNNNFRVRLTALQTMRPKTPNSRQSIY